MEWSRDNKITSVMILKGQREYKMNKRKNEPFRENDAIPEISDYLEQKLRIP
jgi:hypothetical protein